MKVVCHAAGKSIECHPHTVNKPAALLKALNKSVIKHNLSTFGKVEEFIILKGFEGDKLEEQLGSSYYETPITYIQVEPSTSLEDCFKTVKDKLSGEAGFIFFICESVFSPIDVELLMAQPGGRMTQDSQGCCMLNMTAEMLESVTSGKLLKEVAGTMQPVEVTDYWLPLTYPWNYLEANVELVRRLQGQTILGEVESNVTIKGPVFIGRDTLVKSNTYIEGPVFIDKDCTIGPFAYIRKDTIIGKGVQAGRMEMYDVLLEDNFTSKHNSYAAHSVIGEGGNFGAGTITADYRHDGGNHTTIINGQKIDSGRRKLGAFIGANVHTGIGTLIYPGRKMWPGTYTLPGEVLKKDKTE